MMSNEEALHNIDNIEEIIIHLFGGYPYTEEEEFLLIALEKARTALEKEINVHNNTHTSEIIEQLTTLKSLIEWDLPIDYQTIIDDAIKIIKETNND